ncbi:uncharacterized protein LOC144431227 [Styela clava]
MLETEVLEKVVKGYRMPRPASCPEQLYEVMLKCWDENPEKRPEFDYLEDILKYYEFDNESGHIDNNDGVSISVETTESIAKDKKPFLKNTMQSLSNLKKSIAKDKKPFLKNTMQSLSNLKSSPDAQKATPATKKKAQALFNLDKSSPDAQMATPATKNKAQALFDYDKILNTVEKTAWQKRIPQSESSCEEFQNKIAYEKQ